MDPIDQMLKGEDQNPASQAQEDQVDDSTTEQAVEQQTPEEIAFNSLSGSAQDRIRQLVKRARTAEEQLQQRQQTYVPPAPGSQFVDPGEQAVIQTLAAKGIATDEKVNKVVDDRFNQIRWEMEQGRLEGKYSGNKGPKYVREEVEDFIQTHPQYRGYAPEDVFRYKMFPDEFLALDLESKGTKTGKSQTLKPTRTQVSQETLTPEYIMDRTDLSKYPDALEWQEEHRAEIDKVLSAMAGA